MNSSFFILQRKTSSKTNIFRWKSIMQPILDRMYGPIFSVWTFPPSLARMVWTLYSGKHSLTWTENCLSQNSWAVLPAASPSASSFCTGIAIVWLQGRQLRAGPVLQPVSWWFHRLWEKKFGYNSWEHLSLLLNCFLPFLTPSQPCNLITDWSMWTPRQSFQHWAHSCWVSYELWARAFK